MIVQPHNRPHDWCHTCGQRSNHTADIWYPARAESASKADHRAQIGPGIRYLRICASCAAAILGAARVGAGAAA